MLWFKQIVKQTLKSKVFIICMLIISILMLGKGIYHIKQEPQTMINLAKQIEEHSRLNTRKAEDLERQQKKQPVDYYETYRQHLLDEYQALASATFKLRQKNLDITTEMNTFYHLLEQERQYDTSYPTEVEADILFTGYLLAHKLPYMEDVYPVDNALFPFQIAQVLFNVGTAFVLIALFSLRIYRDMETEKFTFLYTLPIKRKRLLKQYSYPLLLMIISYIALFLISFVPLLINQNLRTLWYPHIVKSFGQMRVFPLWQIISFTIISWLALVGFLHVLTLLLVRVCRSADQNLAITFVISLFCLMAGIGQKWQALNPVTMAIQFDQWATTPYALLYAGIYFLLLFSVLFSIYYFNYLESCYAKQSQQKQKVVQVVKKKRILPKWLSAIHFEWHKIKVLSSTKVYLFIILLLVGGAYAIVHVLTNNALADFRHDIPKYDRYDKMRLAEATEILESIDSDFLTHYTTYEKEYHQRENKSQSFISWLIEKYPERRSHAYDDYYKFQTELKNNQQMMHKIDTGIFQPSDLIAYRKTALERYYVSPDESLLFDRLTETIDLEELKIIEANQLTPLLGTILERPIHLSNRYMSYRHISHTTLYSLYFLVQRHFALLPIIFIILASVVTLSDEYYPTQPIELLKVLPRKKIKWYWQKVYTTWIILLGIFLTISLGYIMFSYLLGGWGEAKYPIVNFDSKVVMRQPDYTGFIKSAGHQEKVYAFHFIQLGQYITQFFLLLLAILFFISSVMQMIGTWVKNRYIMLFLTVMILGGGYYYSWTAISQKGIEFSPFLYLNIRDTLDAWLQVQGNNPAIHVNLGYLVLLSCGVLCLMIGALSWAVQNKHRQQKLKINNAPLKHI